MFTAKLLRNNNILTKRNDLDLQGRYSCLNKTISTSKMHGYSLLTFSCHNVSIMKNAHGDRVIIQEVK